MDYFDTLLADYGDMTALERKQQKELFYSLMKEKGFDFDDITDDPVSSARSRLPKSLIPVLDNSTEEFHLFNAALADLNKRKLISTADAVVYLIQDYLPETDAIKMLDELNYIAVTNELKKRFRLIVEKKQQGEFSLLDFLDEDND